MGEYCCDDRPNACKYTDYFCACANIIDTDHDEASTGMVTMSVVTWS